MERFSKFILLLATLFLNSPLALAEAPEVSEVYKAEEATSALNKLIDTAKPFKLVNVETHTTSLTNTLKSYADKQKSCMEREQRANTFCIAARNKDIQEAAVIIQAMTAGMTGLADSCSTFGKISNIANTAMGLYQAQCGTWKAFCHSSCNAALADVDAAIKELDKLKSNFRKQAQIVAADLKRQGRNEEAKTYDTAPDTIDKLVNELMPLLKRETEQDAQDYRSVAKKKTTCDNYSTQLANASLGSVGLVKSMMTSEKCNEDSSDSAFAAATPVDCTIPANKQNNMTCICQDAPRTPGCNTGLESSVAAKGADSLRAASTNGYVPNSGAAKVNAGTDGGSMDLGSDGPGGGSSAPGAPMGGGSAGIDGGRGLGGGPGTAPAQKAGGFNTNILGGEGGGGGGGGGGAWRGSSGEGNSGLRQYLPGGAKDPNAAAMAGQAALSPKEVTAPSGKSNWEKVRDRYRDNKSTLLEY